MDEQKKEESQEPQPIEFKAILYPDGKLNINCPVMNNAIVMRGLIDMIHDAVKKILDGNAIADEPKIQQGGIINFIRNNKKRF